MKKRPIYTFMLFLSDEKKETAIEMLIAMKVKFNAFYTLDYKPVKKIRVLAKDFNKHMLDLYLDFDNCLTTI